MIDAKIEDKFAALESRIDAVEKRSTERSGKAWDEKEMNEKSRIVPNENKAVATGFKGDSVEEDAKAVIEKAIAMSGIKGVEYTIKCPGEIQTDTSDQRTCRERS